MRFKGKLAALFVDVEDYIAQLQSGLDDQMREFLKQWLTATTGRIPLYSGLTRGSFQAVAQLAGTRVVLSPLKAKSRVPEGKSLGHAELDARTPGLVKFVFESTAGALAFLDKSKGKSASSPWGFVEAGAKLFEEFTKKTRFPQPKFTSRPFSVG